MKCTYHPSFEMIVGLRNTGFNTVNLNFYYRHRVAEGYSSAYLIYPDNMPAPCFFKVVRQ